MKINLKKIMTAAGCLIAASIVFTAEADADWKMNQNKAPRGDYYYLTPPMRELIEDILYHRLYTSEEQMARRIFDWVVENIRYEDCPGTDTAARVFENRRGKCGGQVRLLIAIARELGLDARYVLVDRDYNGEHVKHACAWVRIDGQGRLLDPAYKMFDVDHQTWRRVSDTPGVLMLAMGNK
jgi:transglutaminase-like putative cysteine protease